MTSRRPTSGILPPLIALGDLGTTARGMFTDLRISLNLSSRPVCLSLARYRAGAKNAFAV